MNTAIQYLVPIVRPEPYEYHDPSKWGTFSILREHNKLKAAQQLSYRLSELPSVIEECASSDFNYWISQASFTEFNRRKANLHSVGLAFVDLDYYTKPELEDLEPEAVLHDHVFPLLEKHKIPFPSLVVDSGCGIQIKWFTERLPARALPRWDRLQTELVKILEPLGGDKHAKDASRVLRLVGSINQKNKRPVRVIWTDTDKAALPIRYEFNTLCDAVLPFTQEQLEVKRTARQRYKAAKGTKFKAKQSSGADVIKMLKHPFARTKENLNWQRLHDLKKLIELRGSIADGMREPLAFYLCNFYALRYAQSGLSDMNIWHEFYQLCRQAAPHWEHSHARNKTSNVFQLMKRTAGGETQTWKGREVPLLYVPYNETIIDLFGITSEEQRHLTTIIDDTEKQRRDTERHRVKGNHATKADDNKRRSDSAEERMKQVLKLTSQGFKQEQIAEFMGTSVNAVKSLKRRAKATR